MEALLGALGFVGLVIGIVLIILGLIKKKKYKGGLIAIISLVVVIVAVVITPKDSVETTANQDETDTYKVSPGEITNSSLLINLAVRSETIIEDYDKLENVKVDVDNIIATKEQDNKSEESDEVFENVYKIDGQFSWKEKRYDFEWVVSFEENNTEASGKILEYTSEMNGTQLNVDRSPVE